MAKIKAIIFDLDDTLFDCTGQLVASAQKRAAIAMVKAGLPSTADLVLKRQTELLKEFGPRINVFDKICSEAGLDEKKSEQIVSAALEAYNSDAVGDICLFSGTKEMLSRLKEKGIKAVIVSAGLHERQQKKIGLLGIKNAVDLVLIHDTEKGESKEKAFRKAISELKLNPKETLCVGDRIQSEIKIGNSLGLTTVRLLHGRFSRLQPKNDLEQPDFEIKKITELEKKIVDIEKNGFGKKSNGLKVVAIGGGTGLPMVLSGLKDYTRNLTAIVTVTDCGRSSGKLRSELDILPPGDIRNCLVALSDDSKLLNKLFQYRFSGGRELHGHSFGNLFIAALAKLSGSFEKAIQEAGEILAIKGKVLPSTLSNVQLCAELENGKIVETETAVRALGKHPIKKVFLKPRNARPLPEALKALQEADLIVIGPGSLYTSVIPNLLVRGIPEAIRNSRAKKVFVCNVVTQPGQTDNFDSLRHIEALEQYLGEKAIDFVLLNNSKPGAKVMKLYERQDSFFVEPRAKEIEGKKIKVIVGNFAEQTTTVKELWEKQNLLRHDPKEIAKALVKIAC